MQTFYILVRDFIEDTLKIQKRKSESQEKLWYQKENEIGNEEKQAWILTKYQVKKLQKDLKEAL